MRLTPDEVRAQCDVFSRVGVVLLQLEVPIETVLEAARLGKQAGCRVILNPAPAQELPDELIRLTDLITPNESESEALTGLPVKDVDSAASAAERLVQMGAGEVLVTLGEAGALHVIDGTATRYEARRVQAVDTTAAGDAFNGALAYALSEGLPVTEAIPLANAVAAFSVTRQGAQPSMPDAAALAAFAPDVANAWSTTSK